MRPFAGAIIAVATVGLAACSAVLPAGPVAPPECRFPDGTPLVFAGRSTTATLEVEEAVGDPMSDRPADIYITRDEFDQGDLHGRLVCAVYTDGAVFVEITVAPDGWDPQTGRPSSAATPSAEPTRTPRPSQRTVGLSRADAVAAARAAAPGTGDWEVVVATAGPIRDVNPNWSLAEWSRDLPEDTWVWYLYLRSGEEGVLVYLDHADGRIYEVEPGIVN